VGIEVEESFYSYASGVISTSAKECRKKSTGLHALTIAGYETSPTTGHRHWLVKNSWGTGWEEAGYVRFAAGVNACGIEEAIAVALGGFEGTIVKEKIV